MEVTGELISKLERRAMEAERDTIDRYVAAYLADQVGELVHCRITGVQPFGFFATVEELGGDGLVPVSTLGQEYFRYDEASQTLVGEESGDDLRARAAADAAARRSRSGHRRPALRAARWAAGGGRLRPGATAVAAARSDARRAAAAARPTSAITAGGQTRLSSPFIAQTAVHHHANTIPGDRARDGVQAVREAAGVTSGIADPCASFWSVGTWP